MAPRALPPASRQKGGRTYTARALLASITGDTHLVARDGTSQGLRIAMIVTPTILAILVFALLAYFGYNYWQKRRPRSTSTTRPRGGVSPFTLGGHRRVVDLVSEISTAAHGAAPDDLGRRPSARVREHGRRLASDEKLVLEEMRKIEDERAMWGRDRDRDRDRNRSDSKPKGSGSTTPYDAQHDPFEFIDRQRRLGRERDARDTKTAPLTAANISAANQTGTGGAFVLDLTGASVASPTLVSPVSPKARGRRTKGPPTPIDVVVSQSFPVTTPASIPVASSAGGTAQLFPFTPLPGYPVSAGLANPLDQLRDAKVVDFKNALDSPTSPLPGQNFATQNQARTPANARRGDASARARNKAKLKLQVVNAAIKKSRHRKSSSTVDTGFDTNASVSSPPKPDTTKEPPFYSRPPSYVTGHGRTFSDDIVNGQSANTGVAMASPTSMQGSTFRDSGLFAAGMSTGDAQSAYGGRRSFSSSRYSQDVQAVPGPSSRPMSPYSPIIGEQGVPPVPAVPPSAFNFALSASAGGGNRASGSSRRSRKAVPSKSTPTSAPGSAYPPESAISTLPSLIPAAEIRGSNSQALASMPAAAPARPERSAARLSQGGILVISSSNTPLPPATARRDSTGSYDEDERGPPAIPPLPFDDFGFGMGLSGEFGTHVLGSAMHDDPETDYHDVQSAGGHSVSNSLSGLLDRQASPGSSSPGPAKVVFPTPSRAFTIARSDSLPSLVSPASATKSHAAAAPPIPTRQAFHRTASSPALNDDGASMQDAGTFGPVLNRMSIVRRKPVPSDASLGTAYTLGSGSDLGLATHAAEPGMRARFDSIDFAASVTSSSGTRA